MNRRSGFTLIEVMVAVMIISVVIASILQMRGNSTFIYERIDDNAKINQYLSFLISNKDYGYEKKSTTMKNLCDEFELDSELRREFSNIKLNIDYKKLDVLDMSEYDEDSQLMIEVGQSILKANDSSASLIRIRIP
jgi:prepilin-type N-terminal cleavage/methylation domain-containing protein